ncbi:MAG: hypothetical protein ACO24Z_08525 [Arenimonas sp.]
MADAHQPMETAGLVIGVTGHRNLRETEVPRLRRQVNALFDQLRQDYPELPLTVLCPLAAGADQLVAGIALERNIRVIAALPVPAALYRSDFDDPAELAEFDRQLSRSACLELALQDARSPDDIRHGGYARNRQYAHAGMFTSSHCHILLALWDGSGNGHYGGTAQVVEYHLHGTLPGTIDRRQAAIGNLGLDEESLVYHIPAGRQSSDADIDGECRWLASGDDSEPSASMPESFHTMFRRQIEYQHDCKQYREDILKAGSLGDNDCPIGCYFGGADWLATTYRRRVSRILLATYILAALMGYAFIMYSDIMAKDVMIYLFLLFFLAGIGINSVAKRREWHRQYIDYRALAEGLRVQSYWRRAGIVDTGRLAFAHDNFLQKQDVELGWIRNVMRAASLEGMLQPLDPKHDGIETVIREWIGNTDSPGQLAYYSATSEKRVRHHRRNEWLAASCLWIGIGISVVLAVFARAIDGLAQNVMVATMGLLSVTAAVHEAYAYKKADKELIKQYRFMARIFNAAKRRLDSSRSDEERRRILRTLGEAALAEHAEWTLMHRERPLDKAKI